MASIEDGQRRSCREWRHIQVSGSAFDFFKRNCHVNVLSGMNWIHISDHDLDRDYLGMVTAEDVTDSTAGSAGLCAVNFKPMRGTSPEWVTATASTTAEN